MPSVWFKNQFCWGLAQSMVVACLLRIKASYSLLLLPALFEGLHILLLNGMVSRKTKKRKT